MGLVKCLVPLLLCACGRLDFDPLPIAVGADCSGFSLASAQVNENTYVQLAATGATGQVTYVMTGKGMLTGSTYISPPYRGTATITATDEAGCAALATITTGGSDLFYLGSALNTVPTSDVWRAASPLAWTKVGSLPAVRVSACSTVFHDEMWLIGGSTDYSVNGQTNVWHSADGITWNTEGAFPTPITDTTAIAFHDRIWVVGGHGDPGAVWASPDGTTWTKTATLPSPLHGGTLLVAGDRMVYVGGHDDVNYYNTEYASSDGVTWTMVGTIPDQREFEAVAEHDGQFEYLGGDGPGATQLGDSFHSADGLTWTATGALPAARMYGKLHWVTDRYYSIGGTDGDDIWSSVDGQAWATETSTLTHPRDAGELLEFTPH